VFSKKHGVVIPAKSLSSRRRGRGSRALASEAGIFWASAFAGATTTDVAGNVLFLERAFHDAVAANTFELKQAGGILHGEPASCDATCGIRHAVKAWSRIGRPNAQRPPILE
jgi:hypothetical protein